MALRIGFIGCGLIARSHARHLHEVSEAEIVSVFDIDHERRASFAREFGSTGREAAVTGNEAQSAEEVIASADAVYVTTWTSEHPALVAAVAAAGKPVFCEKPLGVDLATARTMVDQVEAAGVVNQVGLVLRHSPAFRWAQAQVASGEFGQVMNMMFRDDQYIPIQGMYGSNWRADRTKAGSGTLLEHSIHDLDLIEWIMGPIVEVNARTSNFHGIDGIEDQASVMLRTESGAQAMLSSTWHDIMSRPSQRQVEVFCERGYLAVEGDWFGPITQEPSEGDKRTWQGQPVAAMAQEVDGLGTNPDADFVRAVLSGAAAFPDFRTALRAHELADAVYRSAAAGGISIDVT